MIRSVFIPIPKKGDAKDCSNYRTITLISHDSKVMLKIQRSSPTVVKVLNPISGFPAWGSDKETRNPQGTWPSRPAGLDYKTSTGLEKTETPVLETTKKTLPTPRVRGKEQWPHRRLNRNYLPVLEGLLGWQGLITRMGTRAAAIWEGPPWHKPSWRSPLTWP